MLHYLVWEISGQQNFDYTSVHKISPLQHDAASSRLSVEAFQTKTMTALVKVVLLTVHALVQVSGHARFVCPSPQHPNSGFKTGPCGDVGYTGTENMFTEVKPGPMTLRFEETFFHTDAPTSIRLLKRGDDSTFCTLLDHIPHNNAAKISFANFFTTCKINGYPIGRCKDSTSHITVIIPDIECNDCYLQLISVMTDKYNDAQEPCVQQSPSRNNCSTYYSCANIKIRPSRFGVGRGLGSCQSETSISSFYNTWPYTSQSHPNGVYRDLGANFVAKQWLPPQVVNLRNSDVTPAHPVGPCATREDSVYAIFGESDRSLFHGIVTFTTFRGQVTTVSGLITSGRDIDKTASVDIYTSNGASILDETDYHIQNRVIFINAVNKIIGAVPSNSVLTLSVNRQEQRSKPSLSGVQSRVFYTELGSVNTELHHLGEAGFHSTVDGLAFFIVVDLSGVGVNSSLSHVTVNGPPGELFDLTSSASSIIGNKWIVKGILQFTSSEQILMLQSGLLTLDVTTSDMNPSDNRRIKGEIPKFMKCDKNNHQEVCQTSYLTQDGKPLDRGLSAQTPYNALVSFVLHSDGKLHVSGLIHDLTDSLVVGSLLVESNGRPVATFSSLNTTKTTLYANHLSKSMFFEGQALVGDSLAAMSRRSPYLDVVLNTSGNQLRGKLPAVRGRTIGQPVIG